MSLTRFLCRRALLQNLPRLLQKKPSRPLSLGTPTPLIQGSSSSPPPKSTSSTSSSSLKSFGVNTAKLLVALEVLSCLACYAFYRKTNRDPDFRFQLATSPRWFVLLEWYYGIGEYMDKDCPIRENDLKLWREQGKIR